MRLFDMHISCFQHQLVDDVDSIVTQNKLINCIFSEQNVSIERIALKLDDKNNYAESIIVPLIGQRSAYSRWFFLQASLLILMLFNTFLFPSIESKIPLPRECIILVPFYSHFGARSALFFFLLFSSSFVIFANLVLLH